jgi:hypothetical protein
VHWHGHEQSPVQHLDNVLECAGLWWLHMIRLLSGDSAADATYSGLTWKPCRAIPKDQGCHESAVVL